MTVPPAHLVLCALSGLFLGTWPWLFNAPLFLSPWSWLLVGLLVDPALARLTPEWQFPFSFSSELFTVAAMRGASVVLVLAGAGLSHLAIRFLCPARRRPIVAEQPLGPVTIATAIAASVACLWSAPLTKILRAGWLGEICPVSPLYYPSRPSGSLVDIVFASLYDISVAIPKLLLILAAFAAIVSLTFYARTKKRTRRNFYTILLPAITLATLPIVIWYAWTAYHVIPGQIRFWVSSVLPARVGLLISCSALVLAFVSTFTRPKILWSALRTPTGLICASGLLVSLQASYAAIAATLEVFPNSKPWTISFGIAYVTTESATKSLLLWLVGVLCVGLQRSQIRSVARRFHRALSFALVLIIPPLCWLSPVTETARFFAKVAARNRAEVSSLAKPPKPTVMTSRIRGDNGRIVLQPASATNR